MTGCAFITTPDEAGEIQPDALVTLKLYVPVDKPDIVLPVPEPAIAPGFIVHDPVGKPANTTLPVACVQVGCVIVPTVGAAGVDGWMSIITSADTADVQPEALVTVYEFVPGVSPDTVEVTPVPVIDPGLMVQFPSGNPLNSMLPVATEQVACVKVPVIGAEGVSGCELITILADAVEVQPAELVIV